MHNRQIHGVLALGAVGYEQLGGSYNANLGTVLPYPKSRVNCEGVVWSGLVPLHSLLPRPSPSQVFCLVTVNLLHS